MTQVQTCEARKPGVYDSGGCNVYACHDKAEVVLEIGGGPATGGGFGMKIRLCRNHGWQARIGLGRVLSE